MLIFSKKLHCLLDLSNHYHLSCSFTNIITVLWLTYELVLHFPNKVQHITENLPAVLYVVNAAKRGRRLFSEKGGDTKREGVILKGGMKFFRNYGSLFCRLLTLRSHEIIVSLLNKNKKNAFITSFSKITDQITLT